MSVDFKNKMCRSTLTKLALTVAVMLYTSPAFAGTQGGGGQMGQGINSMLQDVIDFMTSETLALVGGIAVVGFIVLGMLSGGGGDTMRKVFLIAACVAGAVAAPSIIMTLFTSAGALI